MTYTEFLDNSPMTGFLWVILLGCLGGQVLDGFDFQSTSFALPLVISEFGITPTQAGAIGSVTNAGLLVGALVVSPLADRFGRKPFLQWALFLYAVGTLMSALASSYEWLLVARFVTGVGLAAEFPVVFTLLAEYSPKRLRHIFIGGGATGYSFGWFVCAIVATIVVPTFGWRALFWIGVLPALMIFYVRRYIPESVRFLLHQGRVQEADAIIRKLADKAGWTDVEFVPPPETVRTKLSLVQQFSALRTCIVPLVVAGVFQIGNNIQLFGVSTWLPSIYLSQGYTMTKSFAFTMIVLAVTPIGQILGIWLQKQMPRRWAMLLLSVVSALFFAGIGLSFQYGFPIAVVLACNVAYQFFSQGVAPIITTLRAEYFPTNVRALASGLSTAIGRLGSISGPLLLGYLLSAGSMFTRAYRAAGVPAADDRVAISYDLQLVTRAVDVAAGLAREQRLIEAAADPVDAVLTIAARASRNPATAAAPATGRWRSWRRGFRPGP
jgi:putative MFS transporter